MSATKNSVPQKPTMKLCPECEERYIPENQARCFICANVTTCGDPSCGCARIKEQVTQ